MKIEFSATPNALDIDFITQKINEEVVEFGAAYPFAFFMRDKSGNIIAGCNGTVLFSSIYTDQLWVEKEYRKQGLGKQLMEAVHEYGKKVGCRIATLNTMSVQKARSFYEKLGYSVDFERQGYARGSSCLYLARA